MARKKAAIIALLTFMTLSSVHAADWNIFHYKDEFGTPQEERYITSSTWEEGTFSNTETIDSRLYWNLEIDMDTQESHIILREHSVDTPHHSTSGEPCIISIRTDDGAVEDYEGIEENGRIRIEENLFQSTFYTLLERSNSIAIYIRQGSAEYRLGTLHDISRLHSIMDAESKASISEVEEKTELRSNTVGISIGHKAFKLHETGEVHQVNTTDLTYIRYLWHDRISGIGLRLDTTAFSMESNTNIFYPMANVELSLYGRIRHFGMGLGICYYHWMKDNIDRLSISLPMELVFSIGKGMSLGFTAIPYFPIGVQASDDWIIAADICLVGCFRYDF